MKKEVTKSEKIALCRECHGTGKISRLGFSKKCPQCGGSGRVLVSCNMTLDIRPYQEK